MPECVYLAIRNFSHSIFALCALCGEKILLTLTTGAPLRLQPL